MMLDEAARAFLAVPRTARLATLDADGYPHIVPIWFGLDGDNIVFMSDRDNAKVRNAIARPKGAVSVGGERGGEAAYLIRGDLSVYDDVGHAIAHQLLYHYETKARADELAAEWANDDIVVIRLKPVKVTRTG
jgi:PPOX class probable F420-dependent enzyme